MRLRATAAAGRSTALAALALSAAVAVALSGCGTAHAPTDPASVRTASTGRPLTSAKSPAKAQTPNQRAVADANAILASFAVPTGAQQDLRRPDRGQGRAQVPGPDPRHARPGGQGRVVDRAGRAAERARLGGQAPAAPVLDGRAPVPAPGPASQRPGARSSRCPASPACSTRASWWSQVVQDGDKTAIRVDAQVTWQPARPASEKVPAAAKAVTISMDLGLNQGGKKPPKPVTITDPAKVRELTALINGLALFPPGIVQLPGRLRRRSRADVPRRPRHSGPRGRHRRPLRLRWRGSHHRRQVAAGAGAARAPTAAPADPEDRPACPGRSPPSRDWYELWRFRPGRAVKRAHENSDPVPRDRGRARRRGLAGPGNRAHRAQPRGARWRRC